MGKLKIELKLRNILRKLKSKDPRKRYEALSELNQFKRQEDLQVQIEVLVDCVKAAASKFPEPVDHWDNPSYYLIDFACDFPMPQVLEALMRNFNKFNILAKERVIEFILSTEDQKAFYFLEEKIIELIQTGELSRMGNLGSYPVLARNILNETLEHIHTEQYKFMYYSLLVSINESGLEHGYKKEFILPILLEDYRAVLKDYTKFDEDYSTKFVYTAWKDSYLLIRNKMRLLINLMVYYFSQEVENELLKALKFNDPIIKTDALMICIAKSIPYDENVLVETANHIESAELLYWSLLEQKCEHLYPIKEGIQQHLAKTRFFNEVRNSNNEGNLHYADKIRVVDQLETENVHGRLVRYYLMRFEMEDINYVGWAGGYSTDTEDPPGTIWDETYTDFVEYDSLSIEEHKQQFLKDKTEYKNVIENHIFYESSPKLGAGTWFAIGIIAPIAIRLSYFLFDLPLLNILLIVLLTVGLSLNQVRLNKKRKVIITGDQLIVKKGAKQSNVELRNIGKIEYNQKHVFVYNKKHELAIKFPLKWVQYFLFQQQMSKNVAHLKNRPSIQP